jgi:transcriptional regulator with XRE-family HTH domain
MLVYDPELARRSADALAHLLKLKRSRTSSDPQASTRPFGDLNPDLLTNIRRFGYTPSLRQINALSEQMSLTIGGAFKLFGYRLDAMRKLDAELNSEKTRLIESYSFNRDRPVDLPEVLGDPRFFENTCLLSELVSSWQHHVPIRSVRGPHWRQQRLLYAQLGTNDGIALPAIPPGAVISIGEVDENEAKLPDPTKHYFLQHGGGYICSRCIVEKGRLILIAQSQNVSNPQEFAYPQEMRIVGRVLSFSTRLPILATETSDPRSSHGGAPITLPWEHKAFSPLLKTERKRLGIGYSELANISDILEQHLGIRLSSRTVRRYEHSDQSVPRTAVLLALAAVHSLRLTDVLRSLGFWSSDHHRFSLATLLSAKRSDEMPRFLAPAPSPQPEERWQNLMEPWGEWPILLSMALPMLASNQHRTMRVQRKSRFQGLNPFIRSGAIVLLDEQNTVPAQNGATDLNDWRNPIYAVRHRGDMLCGHVEMNKTHLALQPHRLTPVPRLVLPRNQVDVLGRVIAVASPV